ncbi:MAG: chitin synthase III catalytic subunit [Olpidium bornovanus]|uniref:Chitin synthase export chaperone n=1 Tax=Olpidium bornovanus TaxID=278681 RepID=A0A8H8DFD9_9FUNG|nr:MAG: chitin synthase III catalytic subunit [Olpidium bornovanus]
MPGNSKESSNCCIFQPARDSYQYFAAAHVGMISATCWCLLLNGFVGFQFAEDGTARSVGAIGASSAVVFAAAFFITVATLNSWAGFSRTSPVALWTVYFAFNGAAVAVYFALQVILVVNTLKERWPLGSFHNSELAPCGLAFGALFIILSQTFFFVVSPGVCHLADRYVDGLAFGTACSLLAVMMVYKVKRRQRPLAICVFFCARFFFRRTVS